MIVVCQKVLAGMNTHERNFFLFFLSNNGLKAVVANEVWSAFRFRVKEKYSTNADNIISNYRGTFTPEGIRLKENFEEEDPKNYSDEDLFKKTKNLIERKWVEIDLFITQEPKKYVKLDVKPITLEEFYIKCMQENGKRDLVEKFCYKEATEKLG